MDTYARAPVEFVRGEGARLWDAEGNEYLDFFAGLSVHNAGHCHPRIVAAITEQAAALRRQLEPLLLRAGDAPVASGSPSRASAARVFLCNSGAEASECAIKLVRKRAHARGIERPEIVTLEGAFHGRTLAALAATPKLARDDLFGPLPQGFVAVPRDDPEALRAAVGERTAAVMIEPIQGEAGIFPIADEVLVAAREACDARGRRAGLRRGPVRDGEDRDAVGLRAASGAARTCSPRRRRSAAGCRSAPWSTTPELGDVLGRGDHGSTFAGAPIDGRRGARGARGDRRPGAARAASASSASAFARASAAIDGIDEVRGRGLMVGVTPRGGRDAAAVAARRSSAGLVLNVPGERHAALPAAAGDRRGATSTGRSRSSALALECPRGARGPHTPHGRAAAGRPPGALRSASRRAAPEGMSGGDEGDDRDPGRRGDRARRGAGGDLRSDDDARADHRPFDTSTLPVPTDRPRRPRRRRPSRRRRPRPAEPTTTHDGEPTTTTTEPTTTTSTVTGPTARARPATAPLSLAPPAVAIAFAVGSKVVSS